MLKVNKVQYRYHRELFQFDLMIDEGSIVALMGPSGSGKSTLLALIAGFIQPEKGEVLVGQESLLGKAPHQRPFSMLFQEHNLFSHLTVRENIGLGLDSGLKLNNEQKQQVVSVAAQVGLEKLLDRTPDKLSGGQKQRVALARCFIQPNQIWLLDEPFSALDPILREEMLVLVKQLAQERDITVLMVTHHLSDARSIASDFVFVDDYKVLAQGAVEALDIKHENERVRTFVTAAEF